MQIINRTREKSRSGVITFEVERMLGMKRGTGGRKARYARLWIKIFSRNLGSAKRFESIKS